MQKYSSLKFFGFVLKNVCLLLYSSWLADIDEYENNNSSSVFLFQICQWLYDIKIKNIVMSSIEIYLKKLLKENKIFCTIICQW